MYLINKLTKNASILLLLDTILKAVLINMEQVQIVRPLIKQNIFILMIDTTTLEYYDYKLTLDV